MTNIEKNIMINDEKIQKREANPKKYIATLKAQKTKLLNKECNTIEEFEEIQEKLNVIEFKLNNLQNK